MKIPYNLTKKEYRRALNLLLGIFAEKKWIKKYSKKRIKTLSEIIIQRYIFCLIDIVLIALCDTFVSLFWFTTILVIILLLVLIINTVCIFQFFIYYHKYKTQNISGEIELTKDGILDKTSSNKTSARSWDEIDFILTTDEFIFLFSKDRLVFFFQNQDELEKKIYDFLEKNQIKINMIKKEIPSGLKKHFLNWGVYLILLILVFIMTFKWEEYNINLLEKEVTKINESNYEVDSHIYSLEKFGVIEKELKEYFDEFRKSKETYYENSAVGIFSSITIDVLKNPEDKLTKLLNSLDEKLEISEEAIQNILNLLDEDLVMQRIEKQELGEYYNDIFRRYALTEYDDYYYKSWKEELEVNKHKMIYVKRALEILTKETDCWYVEDDKFYMCDDNRLLYNELYKWILGEEDPTI